MRKTKVIIVTMVMLMVILSVSACADNDTIDNSNSNSEIEKNIDVITTTESDKDENKEAIREEDFTVEVNQDIIDKYSKDDEFGALNPDFSAKTDLIFTNGTSDEWAYSHNEREFPVDYCYLKINSTPITKHFWGTEDSFDMYIIFNGTDNCTVETTQGLVEEVTTKDANVSVFKKTLYAAKKKKAETDTSEFKIQPQKACGLKINVIYDKTVPHKNDYSTKIYFTNNQ